MKELDVLLLRYNDEQFCSASSVQQQAFERLLEAPDPLIYAYCLGQQTPPTPVLESLIRQITQGPSA
jgi:succinate dehydrogenase flavin-adding protein (antitoxin of CptAB toxin-antitoxin module)